MATTEIFIPDGQFCSDRLQLGCKQSDHMEGFHWCRLYESLLQNHEEFTINGERHRAIRKCSKCLENMNKDGGNGLIPDSENLTSRSDC